jgi:carboxyl-terminal processing protease
MALGSLGVRKCWFELRNTVCSKIPDYSVRTFSKFLKEDDMVSKRIKIGMITLIVGIIFVLSFSIGCTPTNVVPSGPAQDLDIVEEAWEIIFRDYVEKDELDAEALSQGAIKGMVEALDDPYTAYVDAETYQLSASDFEGKFEGIGAYVGIRDGQFVIIAPIPDTPADKAGIRAGDIVLEVDGQPTSDMSLAEAILKVRGPKGTPVRLLILHRDEDEPVEIEVIRAEIEVPSIHSEMRGDIAYIQITHFSERTDEELVPVLESIISDGASDIILDLRSNPGGVLEAVVDVASHFLTEGVVVSTVDNQGRRFDLTVESKAITTDLPMVVLVDNFSASGSEVLAGALQDHGRATIAGAMTFGKGSVNVLHQLQDGSGLYITTGRWLTPDGRLIEGEGLSPDYELELTGEDAIQWAVDYLEGSG